VRIIKPNKLALLTRSYEFGSDCFLSVAVVLFFPFDDPRKLFSEVSLWKFIPGELGSAALDDCMPKARAEFLLKASAYPGGGQPAVACAARAQVGTIEKTLRVTGKRVWEDGAPSPPEPFSEMPIAWENAFGGPEFKPNPLGKGDAPVQGEGGQVHELPNVEDPRRLVQSPEDKPPPAGLGPYDLMWPQRFEKDGTYDQKWLKERFPGFAADIDWTIFNAAPDDQQVEGTFRGDESFAFECMHPSKALVQGRLPGASTRCFVNQKTSEGEVFREITTQLDTLWFFPHAERGVLVFHGSTKVAEDDAADVLQIVAACEELGAPRPVEHYRTVLAARLDKERGAIAALRDGDLMPEWPGASEGPDVGDMQAIASEELLKKNMRRKAERELEKQRAYLVSRGLDPAAFKLPSLPPDEPPPSVEQLFEIGIKAREEAETQKKAQEGERAKREEDLRRKLSAQGLDPEPMLEQMRNPPGGPPSFSAQAEMQKLRALTERLSQAGEDPAPLVAMISDPGFEKRMVEGEQHLRDAYRKTAHLSSPARALDGEASARLREAVLAAVEAKESFRDRDLTGVDLSGIQLPGANLAGAFMEGANLRGADLSGADLSGAVLARADLTGANLRGTRLGQANLGGAVLKEAKAADANLEEAILSKADLSGADLQGAQLAKADLSEAVLAGANFAQIRAPQLVFMKTDLSGVRLTGAHLEQATLLEVTAEGTDFSEACLESATFLGARGQRAIFRGARLTNLRFVQQCTFEEADFTGADLTGANLRGSKLTKCDFSRARLSGADLSECDLRLCHFDGAVAREVRLVKADLGEAALAGANLMGAVMQKAKLPGADLERASLYQADLSRVLSDERTKLVGANMKKVRLDPKRAR
jgi:uncharacterized protein YjbI with pentapeptide repeats